MKPKRTIPATILALSCVIAGTVGVAETSYANKGQAGNPAGAVFPMFIPKLRENRAGIIAPMFSPKLRENRAGIIAPMFSPKLRENRGNIIAPMFLPSFKKDHK